jgi:hypothetical protein
MANITQKTGSLDNGKSIDNIFMKLKIWVDGSLAIMNIFYVSSYVALTTNMANITIFVITQKVLIFL